MLLRLLTRRFRRIRRGDLPVLLERVRVLGQRFAGDVGQELPNGDLAADAAQHLPLRAPLPLRDRAQQPAHHGVADQRARRELGQFFRIFRIAQRERRVLQQLLGVAVELERERLDGAEADALERVRLGVRVPIVGVDAEDHLELVVGVLANRGGEPV